MFNCPSSPPEQPFSAFLIARICSGAKLCFSRTEESGGKQRRTLGSNGHADGIVIRMLITMLTAMYVMVRVVESIGVCFARQQDPLPYMVSQPLPWQIHSVSHSRKSSKVDEFDGLRRNSIGVYRKNSATSNGTCAAAAAAAAAPPLSPVEVEKAAATIQTHFRKFQQKKQKNGK